MPYFRKPIKSWEIKKQWLKQLEQEIENKEKQTTLYAGDGEILARRVMPLDKPEKSLEQEKDKFIVNMSDFIDRIAFEELQEYGRPRFNLRDIMKCLLVMSYNCMSYRRSESDFRRMKEEEVISEIPKKSVLNKYANSLEINNLLEKLIQYSATFFVENESTVIVDSTWFAIRNKYYGGYETVHDKRGASLDKVRKLHICCLKNSKIISCAKATKGTESDFNMFEELVRTTIKRGFNISRLLADAGYSSRNNYLICKELGILNAFIDFKKNSSVKRSKSALWRERVRMWKEQKELWHETYRFRVVIEGFFSAIKRKGLIYLRSKTETAQDVELLLKVLVYNVCVIGRYT